MDMKQIFLYFAMLGTLAGLSSCLDEVPYGTYSNQTFYNTEADAESALMYAYVPLNYIDYCGRFLFYLGDVPTNQYNPTARPMRARFSSGTLPRRATKPSISSSLPM